MGTRFQCPKCNATIVFDRKTEAKYGVGPGVQATLIPDYDPAKPSNTFHNFVEGTFDDLTEDPWGQIGKKPVKPGRQEKAGSEEFDVGGILVTETEKAYGVKIQTTALGDDSTEGDPDEISWLPKSLAIPSGEEGGVSFYTIPLWLARKKGFCE